MKKNKKRKKLNKIRRYYNSKNQRINLIADENIFGMEKKIF